MSRPGEGAPQPDPGPVDEEQREPVTHSLAGRIVIDLNALPDKEKEEEGDG